MKRTWTVGDRCWYWLKTEVEAFAAAEIVGIGNTAFLVKVEHGKTILYKWANAVDLLSR